MGCQSPAPPPKPTLAADAPEAREGPVEAIRRDMISIGLEGDLESAPGLATYLRLLWRWNRTYNLTGAKSETHLHALHLVDCLAAVPALRRTYTAELPNHVLDVGSGAGLPGVILAILHPAWQVDCIDAVGKKAAFIRQAAGQLNLSNLSSIHGRVESNRPPSNHGYDLIISRAFSSLGDLVDLTRPLLKSNGLWVAMKGKTPSEEIAALPGDVLVRKIIQIQVPGSLADRCLVVIAKQNRKLEESEGKHMTAKANRT